MKTSSKWLMWIAIGVIIITTLMFLQNYELVFTGVGKIISLVASLLYGCVIAYVVNLLMRNLEKIIRFGPFRHKKIRRIVCMILSFVILIGAIAGLVAFVWPEVKSGLKMLVKKLPGAVDWAIAFATGTLHLPKEWFETLGEADGADLIAKFLQSDMGSSILNEGGKIIGDIVGILMNCIIGLCFSFYLLISKESIIRTMKGLCRTYMKKERAEYLIKLSSRMNSIYSSFISGQIIDALILGSMVTIALVIFRIPYALLIGIVVAVTAIIPIAGAFIGGGIGAFLLLMESPKQALIFLIIFIVLQQLDNHLIYPHVVGKSVGLPPIWIFIAVIVGGNIAGVFGMVMMIPVVALIYALHHENAALRHEDELAEEEEVTPPKPPKAPKPPKPPKKKKSKETEEGETPTEATEPTAETESASVPGAE